MKHIDKVNIKRLNIIKSTIFFNSKISPETNSPLTKEQKTFLEHSVNSSTFFVSLLTF